MFTPHRFGTPKVPGVPHPTPNSTISYDLPNPAVHKAPIHNPYDKFTQPEFDAWIGRIQGALRNALGQDVDESDGIPNEGPNDITTGDTESEDEADFNGVEDSFAEFKARRALAQTKGKARDPREGPGLHGGDQENPIEIDSDSEGEPGLLQVGGDVEEEEADEEEWDEEADEKAEEIGSYPWQRGEQSHIRRTKEYDDEEGDELEQLESENDEEREPVHVRRNQRSDLVEVIALDSDDDNVLENLPRHQMDEEDEGYYDEDYSDEEESPVHHTGLSQRRLSPQGEDSYSAGEDGASVEEISPRSSPIRADGDFQHAVDESQPLDDDTSSTPLSTTKPASVDLPDPWEGPQLYAEDYYAHGDARHVSSTSPDRIGSEEDQNGFSPGLHAGNQMVRQPPNVPVTHYVDDDDEGEDDGDSAIPDEVEDVRVNEAVGLHEDEVEEEVERQPSTLPEVVDQVRHVPSVDAETRSSMQHPTSLDESFAQIYNEHALKEHFQSIGPPIQPEEMGLSYDDIQIQLDEQTEFPMAVQYVDGLEHSSGFSILRDTTQMTAVSAEVDTVAEEPAMTGVIRIESREPTPTADVSSLGYPPLTEGLPHELYGQQLHSRDPRPSEPQNVYHDFNVLPTPPSEDTYFRATQRESPSLDGLQTIPDDFAGKIPASLEANPRSSEAPSLDQAAFEDTSMMDVDAAYDVNAQEVVEPAEELGYSVNEAATEFTSDDDADGEVDEEVEVLSATLEIEVDRMDYTVEEPLTEAESRASLNRDMSIDIASVGTPVPVASGDIPHDAPGDDPLSEVLVESVAEVLLLANEAKENHDMLCPGIPMPVSADPNVPDPTSRAHSPRPLLENSPTAETPGLEHEASRVDTTKGLDRFDNIPIAVAPWQLKALQEGDSKPVYNGLFTPAAGSTSGNITPASVDDLPEQIPVTVPEKPLEENIIEPAQNDVVPEAEPGIPEDDHDSIASSSRSTPVAAPVVREDISTAPEHIEQPDTITEDSASQDTMVVAEVESTESSVQHLQADRTLEDVSMVDPDIPGLGSFSSRAPSPPTADPEVRSPSPTILPTPTAVSVSPETVPHASESTDQTVRESQVRTPTIATIPTRNLPAIFQALQAELLKSPIKTPPTLTIDVTPHRPTLQPLQPSPQLTARQPKAKPTTTPTVKVRVEPRPAPFTSQAASAISPRRTNRKSSVTSPVMPTSPVTPTANKAQHDLLAPTSPSSFTLGADPWPASLSTPGLSHTTYFLHDRPEGSSVSPSSTSKASTQTVRPLQFSLPLAGRSSGPAPLLDEVQQEDNDADGDFDPEFSETNFLDFIIPEILASTPGDGAMESDPFKLMGNKAAAVPDQVKDPKESSGEVKVGRELPSGVVKIGVVKTSGQSDKVPSGKSVKLILPAAPAQHIRDGQKISEEPQTVEKGEAPSAPATDKDSEKASRYTASPSSKKRKRSDLAQPIRRPVRKGFERSTNTIKGKAHRSKPADDSQRKGKGKERMKRAASVESGSSASSAARLLRPQSRASSVASGTSSDKPPSVVKPTPAAAPPQPDITRPKIDPPPLLHAHGRAARQPPTYVYPSRASASQSRATEKPSSQPSGSATTKEAGRSKADSGASLQPQSASQHKIPVLSSTPVTRSHCRYHRISLPKTEDGPRICFLVPGCTLGDKELMDEEEIEDHGDATYEDSLRVIRDIESLDFEDYLIGVLRQLVGPDLLREAEIYYLPEPGEVPIRKPPKPAMEKAVKHAGKDGLSHHGETLSNLGSPSSSRASHMVPPISTSTSASAPRKMYEPDDIFDLSSDLTEDDDDDSPPRSKRSKGDSKLTLKNKKNKRLGSDALAWKPGASDGEYEDDTDEDDPRTRRKPKRGVKRGVEDDGESRNAKKIKTVKASSSIEQT